MTVLILFRGSEEEEVRCILSLFFVWFGFKMIFQYRIAVQIEILGLWGLLKGNLCVVSYTAPKNQRDCLLEREGLEGGVFWTYQWKELGI